MALGSSITYPTAPLNTQTTGISAVSLGDIGRIHAIDPMTDYVSDGKAVLYKMLTLTAMAPSEISPAVYWMEGDDFPRQVTVNGAMSDSATTLAIDEAVGLKNMLLRNVRTGEHLYASAAASTTSMTVTRGYAGTTAAAILDEDKLEVLSVLLPEGADANAGVTILPLQAYNYIQFFSQDVSLTDVQNYGETRDDIGQFTTQERKTMTWVMQQMDASIRWGVKTETTDASGNNLYLTDGIASTAGNAIDISGSLTYDGLTEDFQPVFNDSESSPVKTLVCGLTLYREINKAVRNVGDVALTQYPSMFGSNVFGLTLADGNAVEIVVDRFGMLGAHAKQGILFDPAHVEVCAHQGMELQVRDVTEPRSHTMKREVFGSICAKTKLPSMHGLVTWTA